MQELPEKGKQQSDKLPKRRISRLKKAGLAAAGLLVLVIAGCAAILTTGPVTVPLLGTFLAQQGTRGPVSLHIGKASLDFTTPGNVNVVVEDARVEIAGQSPVAIDLPRLEAPVDKSALLSGQLHFSSLKLDRPQIRIALKGGAAKIPEVAPFMEAVDRVADLVDDQFARRALASVSVRDGAFEITGPAPRRFEKIDADAVRTKDRTIRMSAKVGGAVTTWRLDLARHVSHGSEATSLGVVVNGITLAELLGPDTPLAKGKGLRLPGSAKLETEFGEDGKFQSANLVARVQNGWFQMGRTLVAFDDAALSLVFRGNTSTIEITPSHIIRGNSRLFLTGTIEPPKAAEGDWTIDVQAQHPQFGSTDIPEPPQMLDGVLVRARFNQADKRIDVDQFTARSGKAVVHGVASVQITAEGPYLALAADGEQIPIALAKQVWPITLVPPAREWIIDHVKAGLIESVSYTGAIRPPAFDHRDPDPGWGGDDMVLDLSFRNGTVQPVGDVPEVSGLAGTVRVADETLTLTAAGGSSGVSEDAIVEVPNVVFRILNLPQRVGKIAEVAVEMIGLNSDLGSVFNSSPFYVLDKADLSAGGVTGSGEVQIEASFPLEEQIDMDKVDWRANGASDDFSDENPIMGHTIRSADIEFDANRDRIEINGTGELDGLRADIDLLVPLNESGVTGRQDVTVTATADQLKARGIDLTAFLQGQMNVEVNQSAAGDDISIDLTQATIDLKVLGWRKSKGVPASASFVLVKGEDQQQVNDFRLSTEGADVRGNMVLSSAGELVSATFDRFQLRQGDDADVRIRRGGDGRYDVVFTADTFDGRGFITAIRNPGGSQGAGDFSEGARIAATVDNVIGFNGRRVEGFSAQLETGPAGLLAADISGQLDGRSPVEFTLNDRNGASVASGQFADTGALLRFLDVYERMRGGTGRLEVVMADSDTWIGDFNVRSLVIAEDPAIKRISERERDNLRSRPIPQPQGDGSAHFDTLDINFAREGDTMTITRGALQGNALGGTVSGTVDLTEQTLNLTGTFVPIYALNNFFAKIPLLGFALGGGSGEGLIGVTYRLSGPLSDPVLSVNPVSAIAPGIFRKMFEFQQN
ncbi:hypothetical protein GCM10009077_02700 [Roseibium denhamense]